MRKTLEQYRDAIECGAINPVFQCEEKNHGLIFDPANPQVPLNHMAFGRWYLQQGEKEQVETGEREYVLVPMGGEGKVTVNGVGDFDLSRPGGPFLTLPETSNAQALYIGKGHSFSVLGRAKILFFSAPAWNPRPVKHVKRDEKSLGLRGQLLWRRSVIELISAGKDSDNLVVGETYSPPGMWSGTPLHVHDRRAGSLHESDHEEVYYFVQRHFMREEEMDPYAVQMMFDSVGLNKAFRLKHRTAVAIPGGAHPVVAGPVSDLLYVWGLASDQPHEKLQMREIRDYAFLKRVGLAVQELVDARGITPIPDEQYRQICAEHGLTGDKEKSVLKLYLHEFGFRVSG